MAKIDDLIQSAKDIQKQAALKEAAKADEHAKRLAAAKADLNKRTTRTPYVSPLPGSVAPPLDMSLT